jgi:hypothetical protein
MMNIEKFKVYEITELTNNGYKIARLANNRNLNEKAVNAKKKSLQDKAQLQAAVVDFADRAVKQGLDVVDFLSEKKIADNEIAQTLVLLEGNHRYKAYLELKKDKTFNGSFYVTLPLTEELTIAEMIAEMNICTCTWKGTDYIKGAIMSHPSNVTDVLRYMAELETKGYSLPAISMYVTGTENVKKSVLKKFMNGETADVLKDTENSKEKIERCKKILDAAKYFSVLLPSRSFADWIKSKLELKKNLTGEQVEEILIGFLKSVSKNDADKICKIKGTKGQSTKEDLINGELNKLYDFYVHDLGKK